MATLEEAVPPGDAGDAPADPRRRDYLAIGAVAFAGVGAAVVAA